MSIILKKSTSGDRCFTEPPEHEDNDLHKKSKSCSVLSRRLLDINHNLEKISRAAGVTVGAIKNKILWKKRSVNLTEYDPVYKVIYLGNVLTPWAKGPEAIEKPLCILWKNYCVNVRNQILMKLRINNSSLNALTAQHGLTEYTWSRITFCEANYKFSKVLAWVFRHPSKKFKHELRCHAVLFSKEEDAVTAKQQITSRLSIALAEFKREKRMQANSRQSLTKAYECHQLFCPLQAEASLDDHFDQVDNGDVLYRHKQSEDSDANEEATDVTHLHCDRDRKGDSRPSTATSSDLYDSCSREMSKCLISARSSTSSSSSRTSSTSSCSCSGGSSSACLCRCKRSLKKNHSTCALNYSGINCSGRLFSVYAGKSGTTLIPVRKKHLARGQANFRPPLERSKSAPRLTCIDEEDDETSLSESDEFLSPPSSSDDDDDEEDIDHASTPHVNHQQQVIAAGDKSTFHRNYIDDDQLNDLLLTVHEDKGQALVLTQSLSTSPSPESPIDKTPCYQYILQTI